MVSGVSEVETGRDDDLVSGLVVGGADTEITEVPWQAALLWSEEASAYQAQFCGATVVSEEWLVTAAHCVDNGTQPSEVEVAAGKTLLFDIASSDRHQLSEIVVSPYWDDSDGIGPDIALLRLASPLVLDGVSVAAAVALNVTVVDGEAGDFGGFVTVYPCGTRPDASNLNFTSGQTIPNSVIAPVSSSGKMCFYVYGKAHLLADVSGYFTS